MRWIHTKLFQVLKFVLVLICELITELQYKFVCMVTLCITITTRSLMYLKQLTVGSNQIHSGGG